MPTIRSHSHNISTVAAQQDSDIWIVELDIAGAERFAAVQHK